ncbi:MAG: hypothetical protein AB2A00_39765, partial [Myxococcota bacterium]
ALALGVLLCGAFLLPAVAVVMESKRAAVEFSSAASSVADRWLELLVPWAFGVAGASGSRGGLLASWAPQGFHVGCLYLGGSLVVGATLGIARNVRSLTLAAAAAVLWMLSLGDRLPGLGVLWTATGARFPEKLTLPATLALVLLAAVGWQRAARRLVPAQRLVVTVVGAVAALGALGAGSVAQAVVMGLGAQASEEARELMAQQVATGLFLLVSSAVLAGVVAHAPAVRVVLLLLVATEGTICARGTLLTMPRSVLPAAVDNGDVALPSGTRVHVGAPQAGVTAPPVKDRRAAPWTAALARLQRAQPFSGVMFRLHHVALPDFAGLEPLPVARVLTSQLPALARASPDAVPHVLEAWGVEWWVTRGPYTSPAILDSHVRSLVDGSEVWWHRLRQPAPRVQAWRRWLVSGSADEVLHDMARGVPVVESDAARPGWDVEMEVETHARVEDVEVLDGKVRARVSAPQGGLLTYAATLLPGWYAHVDGAPAPVLRVNGIHMGVQLPAGAREVHLRYRPRWGWSGLAATTGAWVLVVLLCVRRRERVA